MVSLDPTEPSDKIILHLPEGTSLEEDYAEFSDGHSPILNSALLGNLICPRGNYEASSETSMIIDGLDISRLDDDELYSRLKDLGAEVGPIVDSTRKVYEKKLFVMMGGDMVESFTYNGDVDDEYSGSEEEVVVEKPTISRSSFMSESTRFTTTSSSPSKHTDLRKRIMSPASETKSSDVYDPERHTPSPRPSLRTVTSTSSETYTVRKFVNNGRSLFYSGYASEGTATKSAGDKTSSSPLCKTSALVRILVKLLFLALIIAIGLYIYQNDTSESPFKAVEQLARQALEAAVGEEAAIVPPVETTAESADPSREEGFPPAAK
ncbi:uncharacterized protein [Cherax quadricarinatus]|uniref:uncharacterized protein isoform X4 n=1 Tax=Cherax quadricarinatus TaxID=27406 RepID=UPI00237875A1|nr:uncharacterized protein LOC128699186 isoform X4 [Cherax quadricarinatus]